jgi:hypothetical protein
MKTYPIASTVFFLLSITLLAIFPRQSIYADDQNLIERLNQLEAETQALRSEVGRLRQDVVRLPSVEQGATSNSVILVSNTYEPAGPAPPVPWAVPLSTASQPSPSQLTASTSADQSPVKPLPPVTQTATSPSAGTVSAAPSPPVVSQPSDPPSAAPQEDYYTLDQIKSEMKKLVWKKGDFTITPYGYLWGATTYETERSNNGDYTYYIYSAQAPEQVGPTYHVDAKSTRIGLDVLGPRIACLDCAQSGGKVEFDFQGASTQENKGSVLLRHAYWEVKDEEFRLLAGQTWDIISPLYPNTTMYTVYWAAGNIGYRRAQFRGERYIACSDELLWTMQGSINGDIIADTAPTGISAIGDQSSWPVIEGRTALTFGQRGKGCNPITLGVSSHIGEQRFKFTAAPVKEMSAETWSFNVDLKAPITDRFGIQGEYQIGDDLSSFQGGILQGYNFTLRKPIYDAGGWLEVWYYWTPCWHSHVGYCIDDPLDKDIPTGGRTYNSVYFGNIMYDVTKQFTCGLEVGQWRTLYKGLTPGESTRIEFMARYGF